MHVNHGLSTRGTKLPTDLIVSNVGDAMNNPDADDCIKSLFYFDYKVDIVLRSNVNLLKNTNDSIFLSLRLYQIIPISTVHGSGICYLTSYANGDRK